MPHKCVCTKVHFTTDRSTSERLEYLRDSLEPFKGMEHREERARRRAATAAASTARERKAVARRQRQRQREEEQVSVFTRSGDGSGATMSCRFYILAYLKVTLHACRSPHHPHIRAIHFLWDAQLR